MNLPALFDGLTTPHAADAAVRLAIPFGIAPSALRPLWSGSRIAGRALPARHSGSVDVFLEALEHSEPGDVLVVDNEGRDDEACVGDLAALEARAAGLSGIVIWGLHRDSDELREIGLPLYSTGSLPVGPRRLDPQRPDALVSASVGGHLVTRDQLVFADDDGVLFLPLDRAEEIAGTARSIRDTEQRQADLMRTGVSLREQTRFASYLTARADHGTTFRQHLRSLGGAIEE